MKVWMTVVYGGFIEVDDDKVDETIKKVEDNNADELLSSDNYTPTHFEGDAWIDKE